MKVAICQVGVDSRSAGMDQVKTLGAWWVQFGDKALLYSARHKWADILDNAKRVGLTIEEYPDNMRKEDMQLVIQKGRLFQKEYPDIPVLLDKGRYLVVKLSPAEVKQIGIRNEPCYTIQPLKENTIIFNVRSDLEKRTTTIAWIQDLVNQVTQPGFETTLQQLVSYSTRYSTSDYYTQAANWCCGQLETMGYDATVENISVNGGNSYNLVADKSGNGSGSKGLVLVVAHLDSINSSGSATSSAPGADDNASGAAGLLTIAEILKNHPAVHDLRFVLFGGEEQGLYGSTQYVDDLSASERSRIRAIVNMDMVGSLNTPGPTVLLEGATVSESVIDGLSDMASLYTSLVVQTSLYPYASDHVPFINAGLAAVLTIEGADGANSQIHSASDTIDHINYDLALEILRMNISYIGSVLEKYGGIIMGEYELTEGLQLSIKEYFEKINFADSVLWRYRRLSGRYKFNRGLKLIAVKSYEYALAPIKTPIYTVEDTARISNINSWMGIYALRFTLHIDIDGVDPLNVVSGTVTRWLPGSAPHFIGQVTSNTYSGGVRKLVVENFSFNWPSSSDVIDKLEIDITGGGWASTEPVAAVTFIDTTRNHTHGPYSTPQESIYFRDVEVEIDTEDNAVAVEPYDTHTHPDHPDDLPQEDLTIERVFEKAGLKVTRASGSNVINTTVAGGDNRWNYQELHDAMEDHWSAYVNTPQWKMWIFLAELATSDGLGGVMFDGNIDEPGGVDRQGTAIFTKSPWFHTTTGGYIVDNPPEPEAVQRELFFNYVHETGHAFNLAHSFQKHLDAAWAPPSWMPLVTNDQALSWMNYPESATQSATGSTDNNATWFYDRFYFKFIDDELLFLRHAPEQYVRMGDEDWFMNHGRVSKSSLDHRLELVVRNRKQIVDLGESVFLELRLRNISKKPVMVENNLDISDGLVEIAITNTRGERRPFIPFIRTRCQTQQTLLMPGQSLYQQVNVTMGKYGFPFKEPGRYRVEASYKNTHGGTAAAIMQFWVRPPDNYDDMPVISELFNARIGRVLYVGGSRLLEDVNEKLEWICDHLDNANPVRNHLIAVRGIPLVNNFKIIRADSNKVRLLDEEPDKAEGLLSPLMDNVEGAADSLGHITYKNVVDIYTKAALNINRKAQALKAQENLLDVFKKRHVVGNVIESIENNVKELK